MPTPRQIGITVRRLRKARTLSRAALADAADCTREYIRLLEAGRVDPTIGKLQKIANALGHDVTELLR